MVAAPTPVVVMEKVKDESDSKEVRVLSIKVCIIMLSIL